MESFLPVLAVGGAAFIGLMLWWHFSRSNSLLDQWAERNGYYVTAEDREGKRRRGWGRCGGLLSDNVEVRWDD